MRIAYLRVSTQEQTPARQIDALKGTCDAFHIEKVSANQKKRPIFIAVLRRLRAGDTLVIHDIDRGFRSALEALQVMHRLHKRDIAIDVLSLNISTTTPEGELMFTITAAYSRYEWRCLSRRTKEGIAAARLRGVKIGRPRRLDENSIQLAKDMIYDDGQTISKVAGKLAVSKSTIYRNLSQV